MGLIKWIKRELDSSNSCKRRQSEPPLSGNTDQLPRDESYVKALSKFNEWRRRQQIGGSVRLTRKQSKKLIERRGQSEQFFEKRYTSNDKVALQSKQIKPLESGGLYEEIQAKILEQNQNVLNTSPRRNIYEKTSTNRSFPVTTDIVKTRRRTSQSSNKSTDAQIYENVIIDIIDQFDRSPDILEFSQNFLSPPVKFFKDNSNPFANVHTPIRELHQESENSVHNNDDDWAYESPRNFKSIDALRANFKPFEADEDRERKSFSSDCRSSRNPPYQTVINKHGEEVEYALPLNEKLEEELEVKHLANPSRIIALNNTSSYQQYVEDNFQFLNENDRLGISRISVSFNQFHNGNVLVTDLDGTSGTKAADDQNNLKEHNIVEELEALEAWSRNISNNIERNITKKTTTDMHFGEIVVCSKNEVHEKSPRQVFETFNGTLHSGTFHCVPVTQFKPKHADFADINLQLNYEVLRKIRHPDIVLLMGITVDNKCALDSLILEPLDYSLYHFIHQESGCIPLSICLLYTLQITSAVTYLHKHGLIHSNISTHSVVICHMSKAVKLTSFELTTTTDEDLRDELMEYFQNEKYETELPTNINDLTPKLRPYNIEYRKMFSKHNHQAPELLSNRIGFVFPRIQSDVYGICLMLWEMINCCIPFAEFDYDEMAKLIYLQNAQLPMLKENRQKSFEGVLKLGLNMLADKRIADTIELKEALSAISIESDNKVDEYNEGEKMISKKHPLEGISSLLYNKGFGPIISERTSTIKKRKHIFKEERLSAKQLFVYSPINKTNDPSDALIPTHTSSPDNSQYGFEIGEVSIPETPIARSNKLRKTAWLSNQSISPIVHLEIKSKADESEINQIEIVDKNKYNALKSEDTSSNKLYNVNIRIRPHSKKPRTQTNNQDNVEQSPIENSSIDQAQKNASQISNYIKFFNLVSKQNPIPIVHSPTKTQSPVENLLNYNTTASKPTQTTEKMSNQQPEPVPMDQNSINEFFSRSHATSDFENSLWRREKQKCDQPVRSQRRISVKDAVNKFESFSKSLLSESNSPKPKKINNSANSNSSSDEKKKVNSNVRSSKSDDDDDCEKNISKINVILQNKSKNAIKASEEKVEAQITKFKADAQRIPVPPEPPNQSPILTLNFKKLDRRASDLGSYCVRQNPTTKALTARHSIYGSEIFKRLRRPKASTGNENDEMSEKKANKAAFNKNIFQDKNKDFKIKVGKLTCLNCGHKLFVVDDIVHSNKEEDLTETFSELLLTPLKRNFGLQHVSKSTEDFYIDDDFCEDIELCANMELGTQTHLSDFDFDIFSAEIFNASDEKTSHIT